jgi:NADH:ubiquinone oxidoreductase subunit K
MASADRKMRVLETVISAVLVTIGILGLLAQTNILVIPASLPASFSLLKWWPLALVGLGALQLAVYGKTRERD